MWSAAKLLRTSLTELNIDIVLKCGQSFRWRLIDGHWVSSLQGRVFKLSQTAEGVWYQVWESPDSQKLPEAFDILEDYFQLRISLSDLTEQWKEDPLFQGPILQGIRTLRQPPFECLLSFVLSSCNNISRISQMVSHLTKFGPKIATIDGVPFNDFPKLRDLSEVPDLEAKLRKAAFGYRAAYVSKIVAILEENGGESWLLSLRQKPYEEARDALMKLPGVGRKVADCVCLMSLDKPEAVPVDTHVFQIAKKSMETLKASKCSPTVYPSIVEWFQERFGKWSGWAQGVLFATKVSEGDNKKDGDGELKKARKKRKSEEVEKNEAIIKREQKLEETRARDRPTDEAFDVIASKISGVVDIKVEKADGKEIDSKGSGEGGMVDNKRMKTRRRR